MSQLTDPFPTLPPEDTIKLSIVVPLAAHTRIKQCRLAHGTIQYTVATLIHKLIQALDERNITNFTDAERFDGFVAGCVLNEPAPVVAGGTNARDGAKPTARKDRKAKDGKDKSANLPRCDYP